MGTNNNSINQRHPIKVFAGRANPAISASISKALGVELGKIKIKDFADGETEVQIQENVRSSDTYVIQPTCPPTNQNLMELLIMIDALKRASAGRITAVIPYYGYARQDRQSDPRVPISAKLVADLLCTAGVNHVLAMDFHVGQIEGFFNVPVDHVFATPVLIEYIKEKKLENLVIVSPDAGGVRRARAYRRKLDSQLAIVDKKRTADRKAFAMHVVGEVEGKNALIVDDMIDTSGTLVQAVTALKKEGANHIYAAVTHGVFSGPAFDRLLSAGFKEIIITNSIQKPIPETLQDKITVLDAGPFLAQCIERIHTGGSVKELIYEYYAES